MSQPDKAAVIASWLSGRGGVFGPPYDDDAEGLIRALYRAGYVITANNGEGEITPESAQDNDHLSWRDAFRFSRHFRRHPGHAESVTYDDRTNLVHCGCGEKWGER